MMRRDVLKNRNEVRPISDERKTLVLVATIKQIISQEHYQGYDIDILLIRYASGYTCYEYLVTCRGRVIAESNDDYYHPGDALDQAYLLFAFELPENADELVWLQEIKQVESVIVFEGYTMTVNGDEVKVSKQGAGERSFKIQDLRATSSDDLSEFRHDPIGTLIELYERDK